MSEKQYNFFPQGIHLKWEFFWGFFARVYFDHMKLRANYIFVYIQTQCVIVS